MRKPKFDIGARVKANDKAPGDYEGRSGTVFARTPRKSEYGVVFDGEPGKADTGYLDSAWLEKCGSAEC